MIDASENNNNVLTEPTNHQTSCNNNDDITIDENSNVVNNTKTYDTMRFCMFGRTHTSEPQLADKGMDFGEKAKGEKKKIWTTFASYIYQPERNSSGDN